MFYRPICLLLIVSASVFSQLDDVPDMSTSNAGEDNATIKTKAISNEIESVVVSVPTPFLDDLPEEPTATIEPTNHSMLLKAASTVPVNLHQTSTATSQELPIELEPSPTLAAPAANSVASSVVNTVVAEPTHAAPPIYNSAPLHADPVYHQAPAYSAPVYSAPVYAAPSTYGAPPIYEAPPIDEVPQAYHEMANYHDYQSGSVAVPNQYVAPAATYQSHNMHYQAAPTYGHSSTQPSHPALNTDNYNLFQYRRMMLNHPAPHPHELQGTWRGINKGVATLAIDERFIKDFRDVNGQIYGDNINVHQGSGGWTPIQDHQTGDAQRQGKFLVQQAHGIGPFRHAVVLNYSKGGNGKLDPANLISDQLVKLDDNHMLGRATAKFGPIKIPLAYFVLQKVPE